MYSRKPAAAILLATFIVGAVFVHATRPTERQIRPLQQLELAIADPEASPEVWLTYAQQLQQDGRLVPSALAYQRVLEADPFNRVANLQLALTLARLGDANRLYALMSKLLLVDPRLTQDVLNRPELQVCQSEDRFQALLGQARVQSMD